MRDSQRGTGSRRSNLTVVKIILIDGSLQTRLESSATGEGRSGGKIVGLNPADLFCELGSFEVKLKNEMMNKIKDTVFTVCQ